MAALLLPLWCCVALAEDTGKIVLSVSGNIGTDVVTEYSVSMLEELPGMEIVTSTPWHNGSVRFYGVPLKDLMAHLKAAGTSIEIVALNDYRASIPASDFDTHNPIIAYKLNGKRMSIREKGPLFVMYPFDEKPELKTEAFYARSVWQVRQIIVNR